MKCDFGHGTRWVATAEFMQAVRVIECPADVPEHQNASENIRFCPANILIFLNINSLQMHLHGEAAREYRMMFRSITAKTINLNGLWGHHIPAAGTPTTVNHGQFPGHALRPAFRISRSTRHATKVSNDRVVVPRTGISPKFP